MNGVQAKCPECGEEALVLRRTNENQEEFSVIGKNPDGTWVIRSWRQNDTTLKVLETEIFCNNCESIVATSVPYAHYGKVG